MRRIDKYFDDWNHNKDLTKISKDIDECWKNNDVETFLIWLKEEWLEPKLTEDELALVKALNNAYNIVYIYTEKVMGVIYFETFDGKQIEIPITEKMKFDGLEGSYTPKELGL